jgi:hypothetical protein
MKTETKALFTAWYGLLATPVLSLAVLQTKFSLVHWTCTAGQQWILPAVTAAGLLLTVSGVALNYHAWRRVGSVSDLSGTASEQWISYLLVLGTLMSVICTLFVLAMGLSLALLGVCD